MSLLLSMFQNSQEGATTSGLTYLGTRSNRSPGLPLPKSQGHCPWEMWTLWTSAVPDRAL